MDQSDEELMRAHQAGHREAFQMLFQRYKTRVFRFCIGLVGNRADSEEIAADVFVAVLDAPGAFDPARKFSTWLYAIARNKCVSRIRERTRLVLRTPWSSHDDPEDPPPEIPDPADPAWERLSQRDLATYVQRAINRLPDEQKEALILRQYHDMSYDDISEVLHCSMAKVKILLFRAKEQLRGLLAPLLKEARQ